MIAKTTIATKPGPVVWEEGLKAELMELPKETLAEMVNLWLKTYWTLQNYWMVFTEQEFGFENAARMDEMVWTKLAPAQGHRTAKVLGLGDDVQSLAALIKFTAPQWVEAGFEWEYTEVSEKRLAMTIHACPMGKYRKSKNLELLPCKNISPPLYIELGPYHQPQVRMPLPARSPGPPQGRRHV